VFQPFDLVTSRKFVTVVPVVKNGDTSVLLKLKQLGPDQKVASAIDVDDTGGAREITVSGPEVAGAGMRLDAERARFKAANLKLESLDSLLV